MKIMKLLVLGMLLAIVSTSKVQELEIKVWPSPPREVCEGVNFKVDCFAEYKDESLDVSWTRRDGQHIDAYKLSRTTSQNKDGTFIINRTLSFHPLKLEDSGTYVCSVHNGFQYPIPVKPASSDSCKSRPDEEGLTDAEIAGIVISIIIFLAIVIICLLLCFDVCQLHTKLKNYLSTRCGWSCLKDQEGNSGGKLIASQNQTGQPTDENRDQDGQAVTDQGEGQRRVDAITDQNRSINNEPGLPEDRNPERDPLLATGPENAGSQLQPDSSDQLDQSLTTGQEGADIVQQLKKRVADLEKELEDKNKEVQIWEKAHNKRVSELDDLKKKEDAKKEDYWKKEYDKTVVELEALRKERDDISAKLTKARAKIRELQPQEGDFDTYKKDDSRKKLLTSNTSPDSEDNKLDSATGGAEPKPEDIPLGTEFKGLRSKEWTASSTPPDNRQL